MLVVDLHALQAVNVLDLVDDVLGQRTDTQQTQDVVGSLGPSEITSPLTCSPSNTFGDATSESALRTDRYRRSG